MKVKESVILQIKASVNCKRQLLLNLDLSENSIYRIITANEKNGHLTKMVALQTISRELNVEIDSILE